MSCASYSSDPPALTCWKDIAQYFGKGVRTVQRWERELGLPVRRPQDALQNSAKSPVIANPRELDAWLKTRWAFRAAKEDRDTDGNGFASPLQSLEHRIQRSRELRHKMKVIELEHREAMRELTLTVMSLSQTCQNLLVGPKRLTES